MLVVIVSVAILALLYTKVYLTPKPPPAPDSFQPMTASGTPATTEMQQMHADVDAAKAIQQKINLHNTETNAALGE